MAKWRLAVYDWNNSSTKRELRAASSRKLQLNLLAPSTLGFSIPGQHPQAALITELVSDVTVNMNGTDIYRGRCGPGVDTVGESGHGVEFSFSDYRAVLARRMLYATNHLSYGSLTEQSDIVWNMISDVQARTNGSYGITRGVGSTTGVTRTKNNDVGAFVGKEIDSMSQLSNGFEWDVSPALAFNLYYPNRGSNLGANLEYGKSVVSFTRSKNPGDFANDITVTGAQTTTPVEQASAGVTTDLAGRWDNTFSYDDVDIQATLAAKATWAVGITSVITPTYNIKLKPDYWQGPTHIGLGDTVRLLVRHGRINDNLLMRVLSIEVDIGDSGSEVVSMALGSV